MSKVIDTGSRRRIFVNKCLSNSSKTNKKRKIYPSSLVDAGLSKFQWATRWQYWCKNTYGWNRSGRGAVRRLLCLIVGNCPRCSPVFRMSPFVVRNADYRNIRRSYGSWQVRVLGRGVVWDTRHTPLFVGFLWVLGFRYSVSFGALVFAPFSSK